MQGEFCLSGQNNIKNNYETSKLIMCEIMLLLVLMVEWIATVEPETLTPQTGWSVVRSPAGTSRLGFLFGIFKYKPTLFPSS